MALPEAKVVFLGESTVGKTSIVSAYADEGFNEVHSPTIGACFSLHEVRVGQETIKLKVWDTAGQERYRALTPMYYRDAQVAILVYAVDVSETMTKLTSWIDKLQSDTTTMPIMIIVGNKTDLAREVEYATAEQFALEVNATYCECSAREDTGIKELFALAAEKAMSTRHLRAVEKESREIVAPVGPDKRPCC
jgi:small GTP-binding protein